MRKPFWVLTILLAFSAVLAVTGCSRTDERTTGRAESQKMSDSDLEAKIRAKLNADPQLRAADLSIDADADENEVEISGDVASQELRRKAVELVRGSEPGLIVTDKIDVTPTELSRTDYGDDQAAEERTRAKDRGDTIGDSSSDAWIHMKIVSKLMADADTPMRKINVDVENDVVTLRGDVDNAMQKSEAERIAKETEGVKSVVNKLTVSGAASSNTAR
jgi:osmotically-inducible protein OsmY